MDCITTSLSLTGRYGGLRSASHADAGIANGYRICGSAGSPYQRAAHRLGTR